MISCSDKCGLFMVKAVSKKIAAKVIEGTQPAKEIGAAIAGD